MIYTDIGVNYKYFTQIQTDRDRQTGTRRPPMRVEVNTTTPPNSAKAAMAAGP